MKWVAGLALAGTTAACDARRELDPRPGAATPEAAAELPPTPGVIDTAGLPATPAAPAASGGVTPAAQAPGEALPDIEPLRPGPDDVDRTLLPRLRRHAGAAVRIEAVLRSGDAWLFAYTWDEVEAWWREVHRDGKLAELRAELRRRRLVCEAATRRREQGAEETTGDDDASGDDSIAGFDPDPENSLDERTCWERALGSLAPREGPFAEECRALAVVRVTDLAVEPLWSSTGACVDAPAAFELLDVAGAGWPQLVLQVRAVDWDLTRLGFQDASTTEELVVLDPRGGGDATMLAQVVAHEMHVDDWWQFHGSYAHVAFEPGRHVTVFEQTWNTGDECEIDPAGWAVAEAADEDHRFERCTVEWTVKRTPWQPASQRWSGEPEVLPRPERLPVRARELPIVLPRSTR